MNDPLLQQAFQSWQELSLTKEQRLQYESRLKRLLDDEAAIREAQLREERALEKGIEQGRKKGLEQGIEQGLERGIQQQKVETARNLILKGMDNDFVREVTQLTPETIEQIRADVSE